MYTRCIFCNGALGRNTVLEHFQVGRRLAFDAAKGRLWAICPSCERWNLTPIETRWEAIEEAEREFRAMKVRRSSDNIGLARLSEGLELVRIGKPLRPEFAAWRYGDQFGRRRRKHLAITSVGIAAGMSYVVVPWLTAIPAVVTGSSAMWIASNAAEALRHWRDNRVAAVTVRTDAGAAVRMTPTHIRNSTLIPDAETGTWHLRLPHGKKRPVAERFRATSDGGIAAEFQGLENLSGASAVRAIAAMLPILNREGGSRRLVREALGVINTSDDADHLLRTASVDAGSRRTHVGIPQGERILGALPPRLRLAMEMVLHEEDEHRALDGELAELERRWQDAEELAGIADSLVLPAGTEERHEALRKRGGGDNRT